MSRRYRPFDPFERGGPFEAGREIRMPQIPRRFWGGVALFLLYLLMCYCSMLICHKSGHPPGVLVWIPILQLIPLLRAAGMSPAWLLAFLVPVLNIIAQIFIAGGGPSAFVGFFILPLVFVLVAKFGSMIRKLITRWLSSPVEISA